MYSQIYANDENARTNTTPNSCYNILGSGMPTCLHIFVITDEVGKNGILVRSIRHLGEYSELQAPSKGLFPKAPYSGISFVEHVMGNNMSPFISASTIFPDGAPNFSKSKKIYIDINKAVRNGSRIISSDEIVNGLELYKQQHPHTSPRIDRLINYVQNIEKEVLLEPPHGQGVFSGSIWTPEQYKYYLKYTNCARVVQIFSIALTAYDIKNAAEISFETKSVSPLTAEAIRQAGGWGGAWLGFKVGGIAGAACTVETGPGAVIGGLVGGIIFGIAGYWGADWVADLIYEN